ncbi:MAG: undecaprenyl diphosphate synthase family protein, partial [Clostridia bacterium]|nr:undecaprenyl diphosphate synthase family protein [Clostridia bacterium]
LWQGAYSEYVILDTLWPDFGDKQIMGAVKDFYKRSRRFGGLDKDEKKK